MKLRRRDNFGISLFCGDSKDILKTIESNRVHSIVTDPPYGLNIFGNDWDKEMPSNDVWEECFRVLRPGGFLLAMSSSRLYHNLAIQLERIGLIPYPVLAWVHNSGPPRAKDVGKQFDKKGGTSLGWFGDFFISIRTKRNISQNELRNCFLSKNKKPTGLVSNWESGRSIPNPDQFNKLCKILNLPFSSIQECERQVIGKKDKTSSKYLVPSNQKERIQLYETAAKSDMAKKWDGWKYGQQALRSTFEFCFMGQKPIEKNFLYNIEKYSTGAVNAKHCNKNLIHVSRPSKKEKKFYNDHITVKPMALMESLIKLVTVPNGIVLDPFMGSGTTGVAAKINKFKFIGIEKEEKFYKIAKKRIDEY